MEFTKDELENLITQSVKSAVKEEVKSSLAVLEKPEPEGQRSDSNSSRIPAPEKLLEKRLSNNPVIEVPTKSAKQGGSYGNLPISEKQLANILLRRDPFHELESVKQADKEYQKGLNTTSSGAGLQFVPTNLTGQIYNDLQLEPSVNTMFEWVPISANQENRPALSGNFDFQFTGVDGAMADIGQQTTAQMSCPTKAATGYTDYTVDFNEASVVNILPEIQKALVRGLSRNIDNYIINGDTTATHQDNDTAALPAAHHLKAFSGLRKLAIAGSLTVSGSGAIATVANITALLKKLGKYSARLGRVRLLCSTNLTFELWNLSDIKDITLALMATGSQKEIERGLIAFYKSLGIYQSEFIRSDLASTGVNTVGGPNTLTTMLAFHQDMFKIPYRKELWINVFTPDNSSVEAVARRNRVVAEAKVGFAPVFTPSTTFPTVASLINIDD